MTRRPKFGAMALVCALIATQPAYADNYTAKDGNGAFINFAAKLFSGFLHPFHIAEGLISGTGNPQPVSVDSSGNVNMNCLSGCTGSGGGNSAASATGSAVPANAGYTGLTNGGVLVGWKGNGAGDGFVQLDGLLPAFAATPTFNIGTAPTITTSNAALAVSTATPCASATTTGCTQTAELQAILNEVAPLTFSGANLEVIDANSAALLAAVQAGVQAKDYAYTPVAGGQYGLTVSTATSLTVPGTATVAFVQVVNSCVNWRPSADGAPTTSVGNSLCPGGSLKLTGTFLTTAQFIVQGSPGTAPVLNVSYAK